MPLFIIAAVAAIGAAIGMGAKEDVFTKSNETTVRDTIAFELHAAEQNERRAHEKVERLRRKLEDVENEAPAPTKDSQPEEMPAAEPRV